VFIIILLLVLVMLIALLVGMPLFKNRQYRELLVAGGITMMGLAISLIQVLELPLPNPTEVIGVIFQPAVKLLETLLK